MNPTTSLDLLVAMNAANLVGRFIPNLISDACIGPINTLIPTTFLSSILIYIWTGVTTPSSLFLVGCFYGFAAAGIQSLYTSTIFSFAGPDRAKMGIRVGFVYAIIGVACLTGAPLGGQLIVWNDGKYFYAELFAGTVIALGGILFLAARLAKRGWRPERL
jgi:predicted MFS family arabinose efflux permease